MNNDLEKQFFDTFGIEPRPIYSELWADEWVKDEYPQITDRHYLELIETLLSFEYIGFKKGKEHYSIDFQGWLEQRENSLKNAILKSLIVVANSEFKDVVYNQVRTLFKEG